MPAVQTTYATTLNPGTAGMIANGEWTTNIISRVVDPATLHAINFGEPVLQGAGDGLVQSANGGSGVFRGVAVRDTTLPPTYGDQFPAAATIGVMTKGVIWVNAAAAVAAGNAAYYTSAATFTAVASGNTAVPNGLWDSSTAGPGLARLRLG